jgi:hypothetical protein
MPEGRQEHHPQPPNPPTTDKGAGLSPEAWPANQKALFDRYLQMGEDAARQYLTLTAKLNDAHLQHVTTLNQTTQRLLNDAATVSARINQSGAQGLENLIDASHQVSKHSGERTGQHLSNATDSANRTNKDAQVSSNAGANLQTSPIEEGAGETLQAGTYPANRQIDTGAYTANRVVDTSAAGMSVAAEGVTAMIPAIAAAVAKGVNETLSPEIAALSGAVLGLEKTVQAMKPSAV